MSIEFKADNLGDGVKSGDVQEMTEVVAEQASYMWKVEEGDYRDDITLVIIKLPWLGQLNN